MDKKNVLNDIEKFEFFKQLSVARNFYDKDTFLIERCGTFGKDLYNQKSNFKCDAINDTVVLTPDNNIYPCIFLSKPGFEIGKFENDKILINDLSINFGDVCYADALCNKKYDENSKIKSRK